MTNVINLEEKDFNSTVLESTDNVLVDIFAHWCAPCKMISPILDKISLEMPDVKIAKIDVDACPDLGKQYNVRSIPTLLMFKSGKLTGTLVGSVTKDKILNLIGIM